MFLPLLIFLLLPGGDTMHGGLFLWLMLMVSFWLLSMRFGTRPPPAPAAIGHPLSAAEQPETVKAVMNVRFAEELADGRIFRGSLLAPAASVYTTLKRSLGTGSAPMVQADEQFGAAIVLPPDQPGGQPVEKHARPWINALLLNVIGTAALWTLVLLGLFVWPGLLTWAVIVYFIAGRSVPPLDDLTPLTPVRRWLGYAAFVLLALILAPVPQLLWDATGIHCPYL